MITENTLQSTQPKIKNRVVWCQVSKTMDTGTSKIMSPETFTGFNDIECYISLFELLAHVHKLIRTETREQNEVKIYEWPNWFAHRHQKSAIDSYCTSTEAQKASYDETVWALRTHFIGKFVVLCERRARRMHHPGKKLTHFPGDLEWLAMNAYPQESKEFWNLLVEHGFLEGMRIRRHLFWAKTT